MFSKKVEDVGRYILENRERVSCESWEECCEVKRWLDFVLQGTAMDWCYSTGVKLEGYVVGLWKMKKTVEPDVAPSDFDIFDQYKMREEKMTANIDRSYQKKRDLSYQEVVRVVESRWGPGKHYSNKHVWVCQFHGDTNPSFNVFEGDKGPWCYCFGCGFQGSAYDFIMKTDGLSFPESIQEVEKMLGSASFTPSKPSPKNQESSNYIADVIPSRRSEIYMALISLTSLCPNGVEYLKGRKLDPGKCFELGLRSVPDNQRFKIRDQLQGMFDKEDLDESGIFKMDEKTGYLKFMLRNRLIIPWYSGGEILGIQGRDLSEEKWRHDKYGKYHNTPQPPLVYIPPGSEQRTDLPLYITEGAFDTIAHFICFDGLSWAIRSSSDNDSRIGEIAKKIATASPPVVIIAIEKDDTGVPLREKLIRALKCNGFTDNTVEEWKNPSWAKDLNEFYMRINDYRETA